MLEVGGEKVGILERDHARDGGDLLAPGPTVSFGEPVAYLTGRVAELEAEGIKQD